MHNARSASFLLWVFLPGLSLSAELHGKVIGVSDGDTISVLNAAKQVHRVRLAGIDAPERRQAFGERARQALSSLVFGKEVRVVWKKSDRYDRLVGVVWLGDEDANLRLISMGLAWHYKAYQDEQSFSDRLRYAASENAARKARSGLWSDPNPIPPWEFRKLGTRK